MGVERRPPAIRQRPAGSERNGQGLWLYALTEPYFNKLAPLRYGCEMLRARSGPKRSHPRPPRPARRPGHGRNQKVR